MGHSEVMWCKLCGDVEVGKNIVEESSCLLKGRSDLCVRS